MCGGRSQPMLSTPAKWNVNWGPPGGYWPVALRRCSRAGTVGDRLGCRSRRASDGDGDLPLCAAAARVPTITGHGARKTCSPSAATDAGPGSGPWQGLRQPGCLGADGRHRRAGRDAGSCRSSSWEPAGRRGRAAVNSTRWQARPSATWNRWLELRCRDTAVLDATTAFRILGCAAAFGGLSV